MAKRVSQSKASATKTIMATFQILKEAGGELRGREVIDKIPHRVDLSDWEKERYEKTGYIRWESILHFYSIDCIKAGFLRKESGLWILTPEGEEAMKYGEEVLLESAMKAYKRWKNDNPKEPIASDELEDVGRNEQQQQQALLQQYLDVASEGLLEFVKGKNPYEFQDLVGALLRAMGYFTPHIAKRGKDGGIDIIAYTDPLGTQEPRIKVQVKHKPNTPIPVEDIRQLIGILSKPGDVGLFVTSGRFSPDAERSARESHKHIELIDFERFMSLWKEFYSKMNDEEKNLMPLQAIYFLGVNE